MVVSMVALLRRRDVQARTGKRKSQLYLDIAARLFPPPIRLGPRQQAWPADEVEQINRYRIAGRNDEEIRQLVARLVAARKHVVCDQGSEPTALPSGRTKLRG
jgi:prophage regulatory protein